MDDATERVVTEADAWLNGHRVSDAWRTMNRVRDELVRISSLSAEQGVEAQARRESFKRYDGDTIVSEITGETESFDDWGYAEAARAAFIAGAVWASGVRDE